MQTALTQLSETIAAAVERVSASTVLVDASPRYTSSGVVWSPGIVVTADHTVQHEDIRVQLPDGAERKAALVGRDRATDLAVLRVDTGAAPPDFGTPSELRAGHLVLVAGRTEQGVTATMGIVSTTGGPWRSWRGGVIDQFIRLDAALYPSSSGAAVTDASGRVMGIATAGLSRTSAIAIPRTTVDQVVSQLVERGRVARGYLGIGLQPVPLPDHLKGKVGGGQTSAVIVLSVEPQGPAAAAGLTIGDVLLRFNGKPLADTDDLQTALGAAGVGGKANLDLLRGGEFTTVEVTVGERPRKE